MAIIAITTSNSINVNARLIKNRVVRSKDQAVLRIRRSKRLLFKIPAYGELLNLKTAAPGSMVTVTGLVLRQGHPSTPPDLKDCQPSGETFQWPSTRE